MGVPAWGGDTVSAPYPDRAQNRIFSVAPDAPITKQYLGQANNAAPVKNETENGT
jgi:hypothetical protein